MRTDNRDFLEKLKQVAMFKTYQKSSDEEFESSFDKVSLRIINMEETLRVANLEIRHAQVKVKFSYPGYPGGTIEIWINANFYFRSEVMSPVSATQFKMMLRHEIVDINFH
ncbi:hypothetical protein HYV82_06245 [Candidatus Woesearchaeota archaeon]|nr:hypothetical protein [Candidatus Woesearchaeota archaeon]